jgi:hypothetical protein
MVNADEALLAPVLNSDGLPVRSVWRVVQAKPTGRNLRVWVVEIDSLRRMGEADTLIHRSRQFSDKHTYLLIVTDYERYLWAYPQGDVVYKMWMDASRIYHSDLKTLALLQLPQRDANLKQYLDTWRAAFSVERVTGEFYRDFIDAQAELQRHVQASGLSKEDKADYAQLLTGRLMFLHFLQKKGWLGWAPAPDRDEQATPDFEYLQAKYEELRGSEDPASFYRSFLRPLFFEVLCEPRRSRLAEVARRFGDVPFLNGGLFHKTEVEREHPDLSISNPAFAKMLDREKGIFSRYRFTVREDQPLEREVAVDPEMLGKIFEQQVVEREKKGAFYTPRAVVDYMCQEGCDRSIPSVSREKRPIPCPIPP